MALGWKLATAIVFWPGVLTLAGCAPKSIRAATPSYADPFDDKNTIRINSGTGRVIIGDAAEPANFCSEADRYYCVSNRALSFAVPKGDLQSGMTWTVDAAEYKCEGRVSFYFAGEPLDVVRITSLQEGVRFSYLYSKRVGLVVFGAFNEADKRGRTYILQKRPGFGGLDPSN